MTSLGGLKLAVGGEVCRLGVQQSVGWGIREGCGGGHVGVNELGGFCTNCVEVGEVIKKEFQVGAHGLVIQAVEILQIVYVVLLGSGFERGGEVQD